MTLRRKRPLRRGKLMSPSTHGVNRRSAKQAGIDRRYLILARDFLADHQSCEIADLDERSLPFCEKWAAQVQHVVNRGQARWLIDDVRNFAATCLPCHHHITTNPNWARDNLWTVRPFRFPSYAPVPFASGGLRWVQLDPDAGYELADDRWLADDGADHPLAFAPEEFIVLAAAGWINPDDEVSIRHRNRRLADNRLANLRVEDIS